MCSRLPNSPKLSLGTQPHCHWASAPLTAGHGQLAGQLKGFTLAAQFIGLCLLHILKDVDNTLTFGSVSWGYHDGLVRHLARSGRHWCFVSSHTQWWVKGRVEGGEWGERGRVLTPETRAVPIKVTWCLGTDCHWQRAEYIKTGKIKENSQETASFKSTCTMVSQDANRFRSSMNEAR